MAEPSAPAGKPRGRFAFEGEVNRSKTTERGYGARWRRLRAAHLAREPLCRFHVKQGQIVAATVVDHIRPHRGDPALLYDPNNLQSLCVTCHSAVKQAEEKSGAIRGCDVGGKPLDPNHFWNRPS